MNRVGVIGAGFATDDAEVETDAVVVAVPTAPLAEIEFDPPLEAPFVAGYTGTMSAIDALGGEDRVERWVAALVDGGGASEGTARGRTNPRSHPGPS